MKKLLLLLSLTLSTFFAQAQFDWFFRIADSSYNNTGYFSGIDLINYRDSVNTTPYNSFWKMNVNSVYFTRYGAGYRNDGRINGNIFFNKSVNGLMLSSPVDSLYIKYNNITNFLGSTTDYIRGDGSYATFPTIPTNTNQLTNGSGYITASSTDVLTNKSGNISQWTNNLGYLTAITSLQITTALGYTPYNATNPNGYISSYTETDPLFNTKFSAKSTTDLTEGTNLYFTNARARSAVSGGTGLSYNSSTGIFTNSSPDQTVAFTNGTGISVTGTYPNFTVTNTLPRITPTYNYGVSRTINSSSFTPSTTQTYRVTYNITIACTATIGSSASGKVELQYFNGSTWITVNEITNSNTVTLAIALNSVNTQTTSVIGEFPANTQLRLVPTTAGTTTITYVRGTEILE